MPEQYTMSLDVLEALGLTLRNLDIGSKHNDETFIGSDAPLDAHMVIKRNPIINTNQTIEVWKPHGSKPAVSVPIHHPFRSSRCTSRSTSTVALLLSGSKSELRIVVSGWDEKRPHQHYQLRAYDYVPKIRAMCAKIGHALAPYGRYDHGEPGQYYACHAEKQLLAYLFERKARCKQATIHITKEPCADCYRCLKAFPLATRVAGTVVVQGENDKLVDAVGLGVQGETRYELGGVVMRSI